MHIIILMSTYNGEKYLKEQIESILSQSVPVEIVVRDDGSTDSTQQILDEYSKKGNLTWYSGNNLGPGKSFFDLVLKAPYADYYAFADQDDVWDNNKIETGIKKLAQLSANVPALYCSAFTPVDANLRLIVCNEPPKRKILSLGNALLENIAPGCTYIFNRKAIEAFRKYKMEYITIHDWDLYRIVMALGGNVTYDCESHILYRQHGTNAIGCQTKMLLWASRIRKIKTITTKRQYSTTAENLKKQYVELIPQRNLNIINMLINTRRGMNNKMRYIFSNLIYRNNPLDNLLFKFFAFLGWL